MMSIDNKNGIYLGDRSASFKNFIRGILRKSNLKPRYIDMLTDENSMSIYSSAFTSDLVDEENNYQVYEQLGDVTGNKFIVWYMYRRFPKLKCSSGVKVVARLRINYGAKQSFSEIARELGFWPYISAPYETRQRKMKPLLEDVFEAFLGATETILDERIRLGVGYAVVYDILTSIFDKKKISLRYEDLYDAKTRLKELFDVYEDKLGPLVYKEVKGDVITKCSVYRVDNGHYEVKPNGTVNKKRIIGGNYIKIGEGCAALKSDSQQAAASTALHYLNSIGYCKEEPAEYRMFNKSLEKKRIVVNEKYLKQKWGEDINELHSTKEKTKYQNKYASTPLALYCRTRDCKGVEECMKLGADPNKKDTDGMTCLDLLFIGKTDEDVVEKIMKIIVIDGTKMEMSKEVFDMYYVQYRKEYFKNMIKILKNTQNE